MDNNRSMSEEKRVLFVCLGNTCRSPIAEAIFIRHLKRLNISDHWKADSAALRNYHVGKPPDPRAEVTLRINGIMDYAHEARIIKKQDFFEFDWIFGMDETNISELNQIKPPNARAKVELLGKYHPEQIIMIEDPYGGSDITGFLEVFELCSRSIKEFLAIQSIIKK